MKMKIFDKNVLIVTSRNIFSDSRSLHSFRGAINESDGDEIVSTETRYSISPSPLKDSPDFKVSLNFRKNHLKT